MRAPHHLCLMLPRGLRPLSRSNKSILLSPQYGCFSGREAWYPGDAREGQITPLLPQEHVPVPKCIRMPKTHLDKPTGTRAVSSLMKVEAPHTRACTHMLERYRENMVPVMLGYIPVFLAFVRKHEQEQPKVMGYNCEHGACPFSFMSESDE